jgi:hypothetical protein
MAKATTMLKSGTPANMRKTKGTLHMKGTPATHNSLS